MAPKTKATQSDEPADENAMISPEATDLPDVPTASNTGAHALQQDQQTSESEHLKKFLSLTIVGLIAIAIGAFIGTRYFSNHGSANIETLSRESGTVQGMGDEVQISPDSGITWTALEGETEINPGTRIATGRDSSAQLLIGQSSSLSIEANSDITIRSLNNIRVSIEVAKGVLHSNIGENETWTYEVSHQNESFTAVGESSATVLGESGSVNVEVVSGSVASMGETHEAGTSFVLTNEN